MDTQSSKWFGGPKDTTYKRLWPYLLFLENEQSYRTRLNLQNLNLYGDYEAIGLAPHQYARRANSWLGPRVSFNLIKSCIDTSLNKIAQSQIRPFFLTEGGDWSQQQRGKRLNMAVEGMMYASDYYEKKRQQFTAGAIFGTGAMNFFDSDPDGEGKPDCEHVFIEEVKVDDVLSAFCAPQELHRFKLVSRDRLEGMYGHTKGAKAAIGSANASRSNTRERSQYVYDLIPVAESWRLPSRPGAKDGLRCVVIENYTLECVAYDEDKFPMNFWRWNLNQVGFWGSGIASQLTGNQVEVNTFLRTVSENLRLFGVSKMLAAIGSEINPQAINNKPGGIIWHMPGMAPQLMTQPILPPEIYGWIDASIARAYQQIGISELTAQQKKPSGIDSGRGLRELTDIQNDRFATIEQRWEASVLEDTHQFLAIARGIAKRKGHFEIKAGKGKNSFRNIRLTEEDLDPSQWQMKCWPVNLLPKTPAAKLQTVTEMMDKGLLEPAEGKRLLDYPDLEESMSLEVAGQEHIHKCIEMMIEDGVYTQPTPFADLQYGLVVVQKALLKYETDGCPDSRLELLRIWLNQAQAIMTAGQPPPMPPGLPPGAPPELGPQMAPPGPMPPDMGMPPA